MSKHEFGHVLASKSNPPLVHILSVFGIIPNKTNCASNKLCIQKLFIQQQRLLTHCFAKVLLFLSSNKGALLNFEPISIVIPAHNESKCLPQTIAKLQESIQQVGVSAEIIVVDDDSSDDTAPIARKLGCEVVSVCLRNIGAVRNAGAETAKNESLIFVDADTLVPATTLRETLAAIANGCVGGGAIVDIDDSKKVSAIKYLLFLSVSIGWQRMGKWAAGCYVFANRSVFKKIGGFPEEYFAGEEYFVSRELKAAGRFHLCSAKVITSARKLHDYSTWQLLRFLWRPLFSRRGFLKSREGLELLYEHKR